MNRVVFSPLSRLSHSLLFLCLFCLLISGCSQVENDIHGESMGTSYSIKIMSSRWEKPENLPALIKTRLDEINTSMSTFIEDSEISRLNAARTDEIFTPSADFMSVLQEAKKIHNLSDGAWDGSLNPLVSLWGFGPDGQKNQVPSAEEIRAGLTLVDFNKLNITADGTVVKNLPYLTIDLASIAKGYGVDAVAALIKKQGYENFLIEIGGEIFAAGKKGNTPWRIGINNPTRSAGFGQVYKILNVSNKGVATSGDYRNYFMVDGKAYSHIINPRTGYPVTNGVVSVSVLADTCTFADGMATALMVMGVEKGMKLVENLPAVEALFIVQNNNGELQEYPSSAFTTFEK